MRTKFSIGVMLCFLSLSAVAAPRLDVEISRTSGVAPFAIFVDATGTTDSDSTTNPFREHTYKFDFGDAEGRSWEYTRDSRSNHSGGPLASYVYETPGVYNITVSASDGSGAAPSTRSIRIEVLDADQYYSDNQTICLSLRSEFSGCPAGARLNSPSGWPTISDNQRVLLKAGEDFRNFGTLSTANVKNVQIGKFGTGAKPIVDNVHVQSGNPESKNYVGNWAENVTVMDLDAMALEQSTVINNFLLLRNSVERGGMVRFASSWKYYVANGTQVGYQNPRNIFIYENRIDRHHAEMSPFGPNGLTGNGHNIAIVGNYVDRTVEHNIRLWQASNLYIAQNRLMGNSADGIRHSLKLHAHGLEPVNLGVLTTGNAVLQRTSQAVIRRNVVSNENNPNAWHIAVQPQNGVSSEGVEKVIVEDNLFYAGVKSSQYDVVFDGRFLIARGNTNVSSSGSSIVHTHTSKERSLPSNWIGPYYIDDESKDQPGNVPLPPTLLDR